MQPFLHIIKVLTEAELRYTQIEEAIIWLKGVTEYNAIGGPCNQI